MLGILDAKHGIFVKRSSRGFVGQMLRILHEEFYGQWRDVNEFF